MKTNPCLRLCAAPALLLALLSPAPAQEISLAAKSQIKALQDDKAARTPAQQKMDSQLLYAATEKRGGRIAEGKTSVTADVQYLDGARVLVDIRGEVTPALLAAIAAAGGTVENSHPRFKSVRARLDVRTAETIAARGEVRFVKRAETGWTAGVTSQGAVTHKADIVRNSLGATGKGVKIGVLSDGVDHIARSYERGELSGVTVLPGQAGGNAGEGPAMLELIRDVAPGAQLYFGTAINGQANFAQNILALRAAGCDIIVDDYYYAAESPFQDGIVAQAVNTVTADGALYFGIALNSGNKNDNTSSTWEGDFADSGPATGIVGGRGGRTHSFGALTYNECLAGGGVRFADLHWADPLGASTNDYDLYVLNAAGNAVLRSSTNTQNGTQDPNEFIGTLNVGERIVVVKAAGEPRYLHLNSHRGRLNFSTPGTTKGHACAAAAFNVAAVSALTSFPNPFTGGAANPVEQFNSDDPRRLFYAADGTPSTPGNFLASGGIVRQKPDLAAADGRASGQFQKQAAERTWEVISPTLMRRGEDRCSAVPGIACADFDCRRCGGCPAGCTPSIPAHWPEP